MLYEKKKSLKSKNLPIDPSYPTDFNDKIRTVFPKKSIPKKHKLPPKTAKALVVYVIIILTISIVQTSNCGKPSVGKQCLITGEGKGKE